MMEIGNYINELRLKNNFSLTDVQRETRITDSRLSRIENGKVSNIPPLDLVKLAKLFKVNVVEFYIKAGYITQADLGEYANPFDRISELSKEEAEHIQNEINFILSLKIKGDC